MNFVVILVIAGMILFAGWTAVREIDLYRRALRGEIQFLVSKKRRNRRLFVSLLLVIVSIFLILGFFAFPLEHPAQALVFWTAPLLLMGLVIYLGMIDFRETRKDIDRIFMEAVASAVQKARQYRPHQ